MDAQKHVTPILLIIVALVALVSTFAWFTTTAYTDFSGTLTTGSVVSFTISDESEMDEDGSYSGFSTYQGQIGYYYNESTSSYIAYTNSDTPFYIEKLIGYTMQGTAAVYVTVTLDKVVIELGDTYSYGLADTINKIIAGTISSPASISSSNYNKYYSSSVDSVPSGEDASDFYCVYDGESVTHLVLNSESEANYYFYLDYWESDENETSSSSARSTGIYLPLITDGTGSTTLGGGVSASGWDNYMMVSIGFYGVNTLGSYGAPFKFSDDCFQNSTFTFTLSAGA